jgi:alkylresorcinol/alkylpyrone synthase
MKDPPDLIPAFKKATNKSSGAAPSRLQRILPLKGIRMIIDIALASPPYRVSQMTAADELTKRMGTRPAVARLIEAAAHHSGIESRCLVIPDADASAPEKFFSRDGRYITPDTKARMDEYEAWSARLAGEAVQRLFQSTGCDPSAVTRLIVISCTGFFAPGIDYRLIESCGLPRSIKRTTIGFMGCAASLIGFTSALESLNASRTESSTILMVSVELCSIHLQTEATRDNILANMIFADGAAAVLLSNAPHLAQNGRLELLGTRSIVFRDSAELMGWKIGNTGFEMSLSSELPKTILDHAVPALRAMLVEMGTTADMISHWALHPGGRAILDALQQGLCLTDDAMEPSRTVLKNFGNMSSASILFVLKQALTSGRMRTGDLCCAVAFGPGLSMEVALLKAM